MGAFRASSWRPSAARLLAALLCAVAVPLLVLAGGPQESEAAAWLRALAHYAGVLAGLAFAALSIVLLWLNPRHAVTPTLTVTLAFAAFCVATGYGDVLAVALLERAGLEAYAAGWVVTGAGLASLQLALAGTAHTSVLFPRRLSPEEVDAIGVRRTFVRQVMRRRRRLSYWLLDRWPGSARTRSQRRRRLARLVLRSRRLQIARGVDRPFGMPWTAWRFGVLFGAICAAGAWGAWYASADPFASSLAQITVAEVSLVFSLSVLAVILLFLPIYYFLLAFELSDASERRKLLWILWGGELAAVLVVTVGLAGFMLDAWHLVAEARGRTAASLSWLSADYLAEVYSVAMALAALALLAGIALAVFKEGVLDPLVAIRKTTLYGLLGMLLTALFVLLEGILSSHVVLAVSLPGQWSAIVAGSLTALALGPLRRGVERFATRLVDRLLPPSALAQQTRRDSVIVFCDLVGYTGLSARDEANALTLVSLFHKEARNSADDFEGRLVKTIGDAVLLEFGEAVCAVEWAREMPRCLASACDVLGLPRAALRTGIHRGEVVHGIDRDVFGATVNLAARLQTAAQPDEILMSEAVAVALAAAGGPRAEPAGAQSLKNVPEPVPCYRLRVTAVA